MMLLFANLKRQRDIRTIGRSQLFDEEYYKTRYPEFAQSELSAIEHYLTIGSAAGMRPNPWFDDVYYREMNADVSATGANPLIHFIKKGAREGRNPCRSFDTKFYLATYPDIAAKGINPLWHYLKHGAQELRETNATRSEALSADNAKHYHAARLLDPLLPSFESRQYVPIKTAPRESLAGRAYAKLMAAVTKPFSHLLLMRLLVHGGGSTLGMYHAQLIKDQIDKDAVLILLVDRPDKTAAHLVPEGVRWLAIDDLQPGLSVEEKIQVLARFIIETRPQVVHNIESDVTWQLLARYHRQFAAHTALIGSLFMFCYNEQGARVGNAVEYLNSCIDYLDVLFTDNRDFKRDACNSYGLEKRLADKIHILYTPILSQFYPPERESIASKRILWSSRLHPDKRPDLLLAIAKCLPEYSFEVHGDAVLPEAELRAIQNQSNIKLHGPYFKTTDLPRHDILCYLHTARHEGGAITLKEALAAGIPGVAPPIGLISEIVNEDTGWLVTDIENPAAYAEAILKCASDPDERVRRVLNGQALLQRDHSWETFKRTINGLPAYRLSKQFQPVKA